MVGYLEFSINQQLSGYCWIFDCRPYLLKEEKLNLTRLCLYISSQLAYYKVKFKMETTRKISGHVNGKQSKDLNMEVFEKAVKLLYIENLAKIWSVSKKFERPEFDGKGIKDALEDELPIPEITETFELGDEVELQGDLKSIKAIQRRTCGWFAKCGSVVGRSGYVTMLSNEMETNVVVHYPELSYIAHLYPGILKKVSRNPVAETSPYSNLRKGSTVYVKPDPDTVWALQTKLSHLKAYEFSENQDEGEVIGFIGKNILIKFNDTEAFLVHPGILQSEKSNVKVMDDESVNVELERQTSHGFKFGDSFRVTDNMQELSNHDNFFRNISRNVSQIAGKEVTFIGNKSGNYFCVCREKKGPFWVIHKDMLMKEGEERESDEDYRFKPGDIVKLKLSEDMRKVLLECEVPMWFLETLHECMKVIGYSNRSGRTPQVLVKFFYKYLEILPSILEKASDEDKEEYMRYDRSMDKGVDGGKGFCWQKGDKVLVNAGLPGFVRHVLDEMNASDEVVIALTRPCKILGFVGPYHAVLQCEGDKKYKIHIKYLVSSTRYRVGQAKMDWKQLQNIQDKIVGIILEICRKIGSVELESVYIEKGCRPTVKLIMKSRVVIEDEVVMDALNQGGIVSVKKLDSHTAILSGVEGCGDAEVMVELHITGQRSKKEKKKDSGVGGAGRLAEIQGESYSEGLSVQKLGAEGFSDEVGDGSSSRAHGQGVTGQDVNPGSSGYDRRHGRSGYNERRGMSVHNDSHGRGDLDGRQEAHRRMRGCTIPEIWPNYLHVTDDTRGTCNVLIPFQPVDQPVRATGHTSPNALYAARNANDVFGFDRDQT